MYNGKRRILTTIRDQLSITVMFIILAIVNLVFYRTIFFITPGYFEGIIGNLELMSIYYPGWTMRLYHDLDQTDPVLQVFVGIFMEVNLIYLKQKSYTRIRNPKLNRH